MLDFVNLFVVSMYVLHYKNPLLQKSMQKIFWCFPNHFDDSDKWKRLDA